MTSEATSARRAYALLLIMNVAVGLAVHLHGFGLPKDARDVLGDALWAAMIFWIVSLGAPTTGLVARAAIALAICFAVELSQHIQHPMLGAIRGTTLGHLVIGSDFDARDLIAYAGGVGVAGMVSRLLYGSKYLTGHRTTPTLPS